MAKGRLVLNPDGMKHLLQQGVRGEIERRTEAVGDDTGGEPGGFFVHINEGRDRVVGRVVAGMMRARRAEAKDGRLSRAVDAARGDS